MTVAPASLAASFGKSRDRGELDASSALTAPETAPCVEGNVYCLPPFTRAHHTQLPFADILQGRKLYRMTDYDSLHRQCRTLESLFDTKLTSYSRLATTITRHQDDVEAGGSVERWKDLEAEVDELLQKVCMTILFHLEGDLNYYACY